MELTVNRQMAKILTVNRQKRNIFGVNRQKRNIFSVNRQISKPSHVSDILNWELNDRLN